MMQWLAAGVAPHPHLKTCRHVVSFSVAEEAVFRQEFIVDTLIEWVQPVHPMDFVGAEVRRYH